MIIYFFCKFSCEILKYLTRKKVIFSRNLKIDQKTSQIWHNIFNIFKIICSA